MQPDAMSEPPNRWHASAAIFTRVTASLTINHLSTGRQLCSCSNHLQTTHLALPDCRMGAVEPFSVVEGPEAWKAADYQDHLKFMFIFGESDIAELESAIAAVQERGTDIKVGQHHAPSTHM